MRVTGEAKQAALLVFLRPSIGDDEAVTRIVLEPKQDRSRATRERLLEAAVACLADSGWARTTVATVASRAGVSRGAAQHHFPTHADLVTAAIEHVTATQLADLRGAPPVLPEGPGRTRAALDHVVSLYTGPLFTAALAIWTEAAVDADLRERVVPLERRIGRAAYDAAVALLGVDGDDPQIRDLVGGLLDLARGLALADVLTDDTRRRARVLDAWAAQLEQALTPGRS